MMIEIEDGTWLNPEHIEAMWTEIVDPAGEVKQVKVSMVSGDTHTLFAGVTIDDALDRLNPFGASRFKPTPESRIGKMPQVPGQPWGYTAYSRSEYPRFD